jgi:hypothetical protein
MFWCNHHHQGSYNLSSLKLRLLTTVTLASSYSALPDDGDYTETCWSCLNVNFNTPFKKPVHQLVIKL